MDTDKALIKLAYNLGYTQAVKRAEIMLGSAGKYEAPQSMGDWASEKMKQVGNWWNGAWGDMKQTAPGKWIDDTLVSGPNARRNRTYLGASGVGAGIGAGLAGLAGGNKTLGALFGAGISPIALYLLSRYGQNLLSQK